jgi:hypothetical protein
MTRTSLEGAPVMKFDHYFVRDGALYVRTVDGVNDYPEVFVKVTNRIAFEEALIRELKETA